MTSKGNNLILKQARKLIVFVIGSTLLLIGIVMLVTPGPAFIIIPAGLGLLATEFLWAKKLLAAVKKRYTEIRNKGIKN
jgi:uncharacterized protein (TIGR02611 family)